MHDATNAGNYQQRQEREAQEHAKRWDPEQVRFRPEELEANLHPEMEVRDTDDEKIGTVARVYSPTGQDDINPDPFEVYVKVDRGLLQKDIYVPSRFIAEISADSLNLAVSKDDIADFTWDKPEFIPD